MSIKLLIADEHEIVRLGLERMFAETEIEIIGQSADAREALEMAKTTKADLIITDVRLKNGDGLQLLSQVRQMVPDLPVLLFSGYDNPTYVARAVALGASGFLLKDAGRDEILQAIRSVAAGQDAWTRDGLRRVTGALTTPRLAADVDLPLTQRETEVLRQMALGLTNKEIAATLSISYETVKEHVQHVLRKLGVTDRTQAAVWAVRKGVV